MDDINSKVMLSAAKTKMAITSEIPGFADIQFNTCIIVAKSFWVVYYFFAITLKSYENPDEQKYKKCNGREKKVHSKRDFRITIFQFLCK